MLWTMLGIIGSLVWLSMSLATYRRLGYAWSKRLFDNPHNGKSICNACCCVNCGDDIRYHPKRKNSYNGCNNFTPKTNYHVLAVFWSVPLSLLFWPFIVGWHVKAQVCARYGLSPKFFVPPPTIESKDEKRERLLREREEQLKKSEAELLAITEKIDKMGIAV